MSLRTLEKNLPNHGDIWIVGHKPNWLTNVHHIPGNGHPGHWNRNVYRNVLAACEHPDVPDDFIITNDDVMVTQPVTEIPIHYHSMLANQIAPIKAKPTTWWHRSLIFTYNTLRAAGYENPISYELHIPLPVNKHNMAEALRKYADTVDHNNIPVQWRTIYGNLNHIGGTQAKDCKARSRGPVTYPYLSTTDATWRYFTGYFKSRYPKPSRYEKNSHG